MRRPLLVVLLLVVLGPSCKTAGPPTPPGAVVLPEPLGEYPNEVRILRHHWGVRRNGIHVGIRR